MQSHAQPIATFYARLTPRLTSHLTTSLRPNAFSHVRPHAPSHAPYHAPFPPRDRAFNHITIIQFMRRSILRYTCRRIHYIIQWMGRDAGSADRNFSARSLFDVVLVISPVWSDFFRSVKPFNLDLLALLRQRTWNPSSRFPSIIPLPLARVRIAPEDIFFPVLRLPNHFQSRVDARNDLGRLKSLQFSGNQRTAELKKSPALYSRCISQSVQLEVSAFRSRCITQSVHPAVGASHSRCIPQSV